MVDGLIRSLKGRLIVSVQAYPGEPLRHPETMAQMARAAELGGAAAIRCQGLSDVSAIKGRVEIPVIGLWKEGHEGVFITPTLRHARAVSAAGADVVAIDGTDRPRPDGRTFGETVAALKSDGIRVMADCATLEDARRAVACGCDLVGTTLSHGTNVIGTEVEDGPSLDLVRAIVAEFPDQPVVCEGRVHTPGHARRALEAGAWSVVVGTAITHPTTLTRWFTEALEPDPPAPGGSPRTP